MARSVNKHTILGRVGKDPELKYTPSNNAVCNFSVATSESYTDKNGEKVENTDWHNIVIWGKLAEVAGQYVKKGAQIYLEGKVKTRSYDNKDGEKRYMTETICDTMVLLGGGNGEGGSYSSSEYSSASSNNFDNTPPSDSGSRRRQAIREQTDDVPW